MPGNNSGGQVSQNNNSKQSGLSWSQPSSAKPVSSLLGSSTPPKTQPASKPMTPAGQRGGRKSVLLFVGGVVVGGLLTWSWFSLTPGDTAVTKNDTTPTAGGQTGNTSSSNTSTGTNTLPGATIGNEALVVPSTQDAGLTVMISNVTVAAPTWVVVYESKNGVRGNALGASLIFPETQSGAKTINLLRTTMAGQTYFVGRNVDNGDKQFSLTNDKPVANAAGTPVYVEFKAR